MSRTNELRSTMLFRQTRLVTVAVLSALALGIVAWPSGARA